MIIVGFFTGHFVIRLVQFDVKFVGGCYTTLPAAPTVVSGKHDQKVHQSSSFPECTGVSNVMKVGRKSVLGGWTRVEETMFSKSSSCSLQNINS